MTEPPNLRPWYVRHRPWYVRHGALLALAVLLTTQHALARLDRSPEATWQRDSSPFFPSPSDRLGKLSYDPVTGSITVIGQPATFEWGQDRGLDGSWFVQWRIKALRTCDWQRCYLQYVSRDDVDPNFDSFIYERTVRPIVRANREEVSLQWHLPRPAERMQLLLPAGAEFVVLGQHLAGLSWDSYLRQTRRETCHLLISCLCVGLLLFWVARHAGSAGQALTSRTFLSGIILGANGVLMIWLLPPFQGPDENKHWKAALAMYRPDAKPASALRDLPNLLDAEAPRWHAEVAFPAQPLRGTATRYIPAGEQAGVGYAGPWAYPVVGFVSLFFPRVDSLNEALTFYYCCRIVPLILLLFLVTSLWQRGLAAWTLVTFLSLPLVMQQFLVVSTDTVPNLGTLAALLLFSRPQGLWSLLGLTLLCVLVVLAKPPIYAVILLLPAWHLPWSRLLRWQVLLPAALAAAAAMVAAYFILWGVVKKTDDTLATDAQRQLEFLFTSQGLENFGHALLEYPTRFLNPEYWWSPLGWLDTPLSDLHKNLLWASLLLAIVLDLAHIGRGVARYWRELLEGIGLAVLHGIFVWVSLGLVMYLTITPYGESYIVGMQVRYMIPVVLLALTLPASLVRRTASEPNKPRPGWILGYTVLLALTVVRAVQLAGDLQYRYWG